ncbi:thiol reductant ABC exporter subunit CydC [Anaerotardibacter muris]|uniref:thiol reductant ABC exporter subunit CydC n=1 Tax=Anaerotardibacter muris TaxID=2941505 RepID=UPI0020407C6E|nr:thiol reductant ABC exporter subunit CydC [Anaerotardibacter muris]
MMASIRSYLSSSKKLLALILALGTTTVVFAVGLMFVAGYLISASADNAFSLLMLNIPLAFVQIFGLGKPIVRYIERLKSHEWVLRLTSDLRYKLFRAVQAHERNHRRFMTGELLGSLASDIEHVQNLYLRTVFPVLIAWIAGLLLTVIAGVCSLALGAFALGMLVVLCVLLPLLALAINRARIEGTQQMRANLYASVTDLVLGAQDIAIAGRGSEMRARFMDRFGLLRSQQRVIESRDRLRLMLVQFLLLISLTVLIAWATSAFGGGRGGASDWIVAVALGFFPIIEVFAPLSQQFEEGLGHLDALKRLDQRDLLDFQEDISEGSAAPNAPFDVRIGSLTFAYEQGKPALGSLSLTIPYGQKVAVLGKSGSGKSTLARLLHGDIDPTQGTIEIAEVPLSDLRPAIWDYVGFVAQDSYIFAMSIFDNLRIGKPDLSEEEAWHALDLVGLEAHVRSLPDGLETLASEAGLNFSGGQRQRLVLARVLLQDPPIVVLDEPTVGLDPLTEQRVLDTIFTLFASKTIVMITHHLQGIDAFDRVLFIEGGALEMDGTPDMLEHTNERYRQLRAFDRGFLA